MPTASPKSTTASAPATPERAFASSNLGAALVREQTEGSSAARAIADHLLRNPVRVTAYGIEELAQQTGVSTATISRFARTLGFSSFSAMRSELALTLQSILQPVEKLRHTFDSKSATALESNSSMEQLLGNVRAAAQGLRPADTSAVVAKLTQAQTVYIMGFGLSAHLAGLLSLHLQPFCNQVINVVEFGGTEVAAGRLMSISSKDVLVVISFPRYAADVVKLGKFAADKGACVVALTDSPASPLARGAHYLLLAPCTHPVLSSSLSAALAVIETLTASLMTSNRMNVTKAEQLTEAISSYLHDETPPIRAHAKRGLPKAKAQLAINPLPKKTSRKSK
jgi:DNA-binding MurR/RpiR family transcriptional regulator